MQSFSSLPPGRKLRSEQKLKSPTSSTASALSLRMRAQSSSWVRRNGAESSDSKCIVPTARRVPAPASYTPNTSLRPMRVGRTAMARAAARGRANNTTPYRSIVVPSMSETE
eukprot:Amastigsp_a509413_144.p4 type:complete len:112 gc:universal Amastigsp_a509413_144:495-830(+)